MTRETDTLLTDMRACAGELFPYRDPDQFNPPDYVLVLGVTLRREIETLRDSLAELSGTIDLMNEPPRRPTRDEQLGISKTPEDCV